MLRDQNQTPQFLQALQRVDLLIGQCIQASRTLTAELSPPVLYEAGLTAALKWLGRWFGKTHGLTVRVTGDEQGVTQPEDSRIALFQAVRELLFNVVKHAQVKRAHVRITCPQGRQLRIVVADDGVGFDPRQVQAREGSAGKFGLFSVRERLEFLGMNLSIDSAPGRGSRFTLLAPLPGSSPANAQTSAALEPETFVGPRPQAPR
jgi:signal transduction histidine kinase